MLKKHKIRSFYKCQNNKFYEIIMFLYRKNKNFAKSYKKNNKLRFLNQVRNDKFSEAVMFYKVILGVFFLLLLPSFLQAASIKMNLTNKTENLSIGENIISSIFIEAGEENVQLRNLKISCNYNNLTDWNIILRDNADNNLKKNTVVNNNINFGFVDYQFIGNVELFLIADIPEESEDLTEANIECNFNNQDVEFATLNNGNIYNPNSSVINGIKPKIFVEKLVKTVVPAASENISIMKFVLITEYDLFLNSLELECSSNLIDKIKLQETTNGAFFNNIAVSNFGLKSSWSKIQIKFQINEQILKGRKNYLITATIPEEMKNQILSCAFINNDSVAATVDDSLIEIDVDDSFSNLQIEAPLVDESELLQNLENSSFNEKEEEMINIKEKEEETIENGSIEMGTDVATVESGVTEPLNQISEQVPEQQPKQPDNSEQQDNIETSELDSSSQEPPTPLVFLLDCALEQSKTYCTKQCEILTSNEYSCVKQAEKISFKKEKEQLSQDLIKQCFLEKKSADICLNICKLSFVEDPENCETALNIVFFGISNEEERKRIVNILEKNYIAWKKVSKIGK